MAVEFWVAPYTHDSVKLSSYKIQWTCHPGQELNPDSPVQ